MIIIETKLHIPRVREGLISRAHLMKVLDDGLNYKLTLVTAPAGYGKTTVLCEWIKDVKYPVVWVSLDEGDNNWMHFWMHVITAVKQAVPSFDAKDVLSLSLLGDSDDSLIATLINELNRLPEPLIIVWDDFHCMENTSIIDGVTYLLKRLPVHIHFFITSRIQPSLPLSKMRINGELNLVNTEDLRFKQSESMELFKSMHELDLSIEETSAVLERTEGWITGLHLAIISLNNKNKRSTFIQGITGDQRDIAAYFFEEVLGNQDEEMQTFLLKTSILGRMNGELCEAITGIDKSVLFLRELELNNLFIISLDADQTWYRYHHLFQEFLRMHLKTLQQEQLKMLHMEAGRWFEKNGDVAEAINHYLCYANYEEVLRLLEKMESKLMLYGWSAIRNWLDAIPNELLFTKPLLYMMNSMSYLLSGQLEIGKEKLEWVTDKLEQTGVTFSEELVKQYETGLYFLHIIYAYFENDFETAIHYSEEFVQRNPAGDFSLGLILEGDAEHPTWDLSVTISSLHEAESILKRLLAIWSNTENYHFEADARMGYGMLMHEWNRLEEAEIHLQRARDLGITHKNAIISIISGILLAKTLLAGGQLGKLEDLLIELVEEVNNGRYVSLKMKIATLQAQIKSVQGDVQHALTWLDVCGIQPSDEIPLFMLEEYELLACLLADQGRTQEAIQLINRLLYINTKAGRKRDIIRLTMEKGLILARQGEIVRSLDLLEEALALGEAEGYIRTFLDRGVPFSNLLAVYREMRRKQDCNSPNKVSKAYVNQLSELKPIGLVDSVKRPPQKNLNEKLTPKEMNILLLIQTGMTNNEMAMELNISLSTVKSHLNNLYRKLKVNNRMLAVQRATQLGLL